MTDLLEALRERCNQWIEGVQKVCDENIPLNGPSLIAFLHDVRLALSQNGAKWCEYCKKDNHNDAECWSTRPGGWKVYQPLALPPGVAQNGEPKPTAYCLMNADGKMYWDEEECIWGVSGDCISRLEDLEEDEPDSGWHEVPLYAHP